MSYLAVEKSGKEIITRNKPRYLEDKWSDEYHRYGYFGAGITKLKVIIKPDTRIILPKGTIEKLLGYKLTFESSPVKFK